MNIDPYYKPFEVQLAHSHAGLRHRRSAHALSSEGLLGGLRDAQFKEVRRCHALGSFVSKDGGLMGVLCPKELTFLVGENRVWIPALRYLSTLSNSVASTLHCSGNELQSFLILPEIRGKEHKEA